MTISLSPSKMYGHWTHCDPRVCEFQHGKTMIYVSYNADKSMDERLAIAQKTIDVVFEEAEEALVFASQISAKQKPDFWRAANKISIKQSPLIIFSVSYPLESDLPIYEISWNPIFEPESALVISDDGEEELVLVDTPDDNKFINVKRLGKLQYEQVV